jgi:hypothetical protein
MRLMHDKDIFNETINDFSRLEIFQKGYDPISIATIPLDNIIILENKKIIIGLTKISASPYKIVIYSFGGKLIYKGSLGVDMIKIGHKKLNRITRKFPDLIASFQKNGNIIKRDSFYYIELTPESKLTLGTNFRTEYFADEWLYLSSYLPFKVATSWNSPNQFDRLIGGYLNSSPYSDLIVINDVPFVLVLNNVEGGKSYLPLISNYNTQVDFSPR